MGKFADISTASEILKTRTGTAFAKRGSRSLFRRFRVFTSNPLHGPNEICQADGIPAPYSSYTTADGPNTDATAVCTQLDADLDPQAEDDGRYWWIVVATYSTDVPAEGIPGFTKTGDYFVGSQTQPWLEPPMIRWESETISRAFPNDLDGKPYLNSAYQPFTPPPVFEVSRPVLVLTRNQPTFTPENAADYAFAVNADDFFGYPPGCAQCFPIHAEHDQRGSVEFYRATYRIRFATKIAVPTVILGNTFWSITYESFQPRVLDAGMCQLQKVLGFPFNNKPVPILGNGGFPISQPVLLDGTGSRTVPGGDGKYTPTYIDFRQFLAKPFGIILATGVW